MARPRPRATPAPGGRVRSRSKYAPAVPPECFEALSRRRRGRPHPGDADLLKDCREKYGYNGPRAKPDPDAEHDPPLPLFESAAARARRRIDFRRRPTPSAGTRLRARLAGRRASAPGGSSQHRAPLPGASPHNERFKDVKIPEAHNAGGRTPHEIAGQLPVWKPGDPAHGALVVNGKIYLLKSSGGEGRPSYSRDLVPHGAHAWDMGFTKKNIGHVEAQAAALLRKLAHDGHAIRDAKLVINRPFVCRQNGDGCAPGLRQMLPPGTRFEVWCSGPGSQEKNQVVLAESFRGRNK